MALAQHPAMVETNQRFELVTSDGGADAAESGTGLAQQRR